MFFFVFFFGCLRGYACDLVEDVEHRRYRFESGICTSA